jgi:hypothetical protein
MTQLVAMNLSVTMFDFYYLIVSEKTKVKSSLAYSKKERYLIEIILFLFNYKYYERKVGA